MPVSVADLANAKIITFVIFILMLPPSIVSAGSLSDVSQLPEPDARLHPEDVVNIVVQALANNDEPFPDAGIETAFNFASPANKRVTGPLERFITMVKNPVFAVMLNHKKSEFSKLVLQQGRAYQIVRLITIDDTEVYFAFRLSLQYEGEYQGMWMTEAVWPLEIPPGGIGI